MTIECKSCEAQFTVGVEVEGIDGIEISYCPFCGELIDDSHHGIDDDGEDEDDEDND